MVGIGIGRAVLVFTFVYHCHGFLSVLVLLSLFENGITSESHYIIFLVLRRLADILSS
jgi:hypothetical protein